MLIAIKFGKEDDSQFSLPNLTKDVPKDMTYRIAINENCPKFTVQVNLIYFQKYKLKGEK